MGVCNETPHRDVREVKASEQNVGKTGSVSFLELKEDLEWTESQGRRQGLLFADFSV